MSSVAAEMLTEAQDREKKLYQRLDERAEEVGRLRAQIERLKAQRDALADALRLEVELVDHFIETTNRQPDDYVVHNQASAALDGVENANHAD